MRDNIKVWKCEGCDEPCFGVMGSPEERKELPPGRCINNIRHDSEWKLSTDHQITKITAHAPIEYLDISTELEHSVHPVLQNANKKDLVKVYRMVGKYAEVIIDGASFNVHVSWIKTRPAEPTVEELKTRLAEVVKFTKESSVSDAYKNLIAKFANGE